MGDRARFEFLEAARQSRFLPVELGAPTPAVRGRLALFVEGAIERCLDAHRAPPPGVGASSGLRGSLEDQLQRARQSGVRGIALSFATLVGIADAHGALDNEDSAALAWWVGTAASDAGLRVALDATDRELRIYGEPVPLEAILPNSTASSDFDVEHMEDAGRETVPDAPSPSTDVAPIDPATADDDLAASALLLAEELDNGSEWLRETLMQICTPVPEAIADSESDVEPHSTAPDAFDRSSGEFIMEPLELLSPPPVDSFLVGAPSPADDADAAEVQVDETASVVDDELEEFARITQPWSPAPLDVAFAEGPGNAASGGAIAPSQDGLEDAETGSVDDGAQEASVATETPESSSGALPEPSHDSDIAVEPLDHEEMLDDFDEPVEDRQTAVGLGLEPFDDKSASEKRPPPEMVESPGRDTPEPDPEVTARCVTWQHELQSSQGPKPLAVVERQYVSAYLPLRNAVLRGVAPTSAKSALAEWSSSFAKSYSEAFDALRHRGKRPTMVLDVPDLALRLARLHGARSTQLLLVDGMRFDLGRSIHDRLRERVNGLAVCAERLLLWSALPSTTSVQLELIGRGPMALRDFTGNVDEQLVVSRGKKASTIRRLRAGQRELLKLDIAEARLSEPGGPELARLDEIANEIAERLALHFEGVPERTLVVMFGDHGFHLDPLEGGTQAARHGGASPEEVLVPAFAWLVGAVH